MAEYSFEKKKEMVLAYLSGRDSFDYWGNQYNIEPSNIRRSKGLFRYSAFK